MKFSEFICENLWTSIISIMGQQRLRCSPKNSYFYHVENILQNPNQKLKARLALGSLQFSVKFLGLRFK